MLVKELMQTKVYYVTADAPVSDAAALMKNHSVGIVPVCDSKGSLMGVITDRDLIVRWPFPAAGQTPVRDAMSTQVVSVSSNTDIHDAAVVFSNKKVRRLPVLENGKLIGILSLSDLARKRIFLAEVGEIMGSISK